MKETQKERIEREIRGEPTGFDVLLKRKMRNLEDIKNLIWSERLVSHKEIAKRLGISLRSVSRYLAELRLRGIFDKWVFKTQADIQMEEKKKRRKRLERLIKAHPEWSRRRYAEELGVSVKTLRGYFRELPFIGRER